MVTTMIPAGLLMAFWRGRMRDEVELPLPPDELLDPLPLLLLPLDEDESLLCKVSSVKKGTKK
jgi:hypothetical protein